MMIIVTTSKKSNLRLSQKMRSSKSKRSIHAYITVILFASLIGTYLDLVCVEMGMYSFPIRLFPGLFSINILFTLIILPVASILFIRVMRHLKTIPRTFFLFTCSFLICMIEQIAEQVGLFVHHEDWNHIYSFVGYFIFLVVIWKGFSWLSK
ncbi:CBO0543 family protein [Virgibacillus salarius]|uniref:CBO0543 family protein n=2 Tax=Virgibacillus TaxID=84406 RepID=UPI001267C454|nr:CBO0543 family protein [Priestia megaterium]